MWSDTSRLYCFKVHEEHSTFTLSAYFAMMLYHNIRDLFFFRLQKCSIAVYFIAHNKELCLAHYIAVHLQYRTKEL